MVTGNTGDVTWKFESLNQTADGYLYLFKNTVNSSPIAADDDHPQHGTRGSVIPVNGTSFFTPEAGVQYIIAESHFSSLRVHSYDLYFSQKRTSDGQVDTYQIDNGEEIPPLLDITTGAALTTGATIEGYTLDTVANPITATLDEDQGLPDDAVVNDPSNTGINVTGAEANSTVEYALNDGAYVASYDDIKGSITDGDTVNVRHTDLAGNVSSTSVTVTVDTTAPEMAGVADGSGIKTSGHVVYTITFDEPVLPGSIDLADFVFTGGDLTPSSVTATGTPDFGNATDGFTKVDIRFDVNGDGILDAALASTATIVDLAGNNFVFASGDAGSDQNIFSADMDNVPRQ